MDAVAVMPVSERRDLFTETAEQVGFDFPAIAEKDFWVCWTLKRIFSLPPPYSKLIFKGGTTLSKVYRIIRRFSEDIDLAVDRHDLGFTGQRDPSNLSGGKRKDRVKEIVKACAEYVINDFRLEVEKDFTEILGAPGDNWHIEPSPNRAGSLDFYYPTVFAEPENAPRYARRFIFLEIGARAENWPTLETEIRPFAAEKFPDFFKVSKACKVKVLLAERTFWEKAFVLFRETCTPLNHEKIERLSRHYYDLAMIGRNEAAERAIQDGKLLSAVCEFDQIFFRRSGVDYENAKRGTFRLIPSMEKQNELKKDYDKMSKEMFYGQQPDFNQIITELKALEHRINKV